MFLWVSTPRSRMPGERSPGAGWLAIRWVTLSATRAAVVQELLASTLRRARAHTWRTETQLFLPPTPSPVLSLLCLISESVKWAGAHSQGLFFSFSFIWKPVERQKQTGFWLRKDDLPCKEFKSFNFRGERGRNAVCIRKLTWGREGGREAASSSYHFGASKDPHFPELPL